MTRFYEYGIDLGTTNSSVSKLGADGKPETISNRDQKLVTPSMVYIDSKQRLFVGERAKNGYLRQVNDVQKEFKRTMGTSQLLKFESSGLSKTPVELSSEILKSLRNDINSRYQCDAVDVIITVPAAFNAIQCEDTIQAGIMAGFINIKLLQEPIAASLAYGVQPNSKDKYWLVYDFGGGTFDAAVVSTFNKSLEVLSHDGDNHLGGKDIDRKIYEKLVLPKLKALGIIPTLSDERRLISIAEDVKIELSTENRSRFITDDELNLVDSKGKVSELDFWVEKSELENVVDEFIEKSLHLCDQALQKSKIQANQLEKILLVGGITFIPRLRSIVKEHFNRPVDTSIDPMTVVSQGAAIYGASYKVEEKNKKINPDAKYSLKVEYESQTPNEVYNIMGKVISTEKDELSQISFRNSSGFWESGWIKLGNGNFFELDLHLAINSINNFEILVMNTSGVVKNVEEEIVIRHNSNSIKVSDAPLPHNISVELIKDSGTILDVLFLKGTPLPSIKEQVYKSAKTIRQGSSDELNIKVYEGQDLKNPKHNILLGYLSIRGTDISQTITQNEPVKISIKLNDSRAFILNAETQESKQSFSININFSKESPDQILVRNWESLKEIGENLNEIRTVEISKNEGFISLGKKLIELKEKNRSIEQEDKNTKNQRFDEICFLDEETKLLAQESEKFCISYGSEALIKKREQEIASIDDIVEYYADSDKEKYHNEYKAAYNESVKSGDVEKQNYFMEKMTTNATSVKLDNMFFLKDYFKTYTSGYFSYSNEEKYQQLVVRGNSAIRSDDEDSLRNVIFDLNRLTIDNGAKDDLLSGLTK